MAERILIAGLGNIFCGDDGFGVEVVQRLRGRSLPETVIVKDIGIRGLDLTYALLEDYGTVVLVDAVSRGTPAGTLFVIEPESEAASDRPAAEDSKQDESTPQIDDAPFPMIDPHDLDPAKVLRLARRLGSKVQRVLVVGCEPAALGNEEDVCCGLSESVENAIGRAVELVEQLIGEINKGGSASCMRC